MAWRPGAYDRSVPSSRLRTFVPVGHLARAGHQAVVMPRDGSGQFDCVVFQKAFSDDDVTLARRLSAQRVRIVFDLCDNYLENPNQLAEQTARRDRLERMLDLADAVTVSTPTLQEALSPRPSVVVDDALDLPRGAGAWVLRQRAGAAARRRLGRPLRLVWFGTAGSEAFSFGLNHLAPVLPLLDELHRSQPLEMTVISNSQPLFDRHVGRRAFPCRYIPWQASSFARHLTSHDECLIPIQRNPFTVCKTSNRVVLSLALGVPVVTSPIPSYQEFAQWLLFEDWAANVWAYQRDPRVARGHVDGARAHIRATYTPGRLVDQWSGVLDAVLAGR